MPQSVDYQDINILHVNGVHQLTVQYCACQGQPKPAWEQLIEGQIFPATELKPATGFTFNVLQTFQALNLRGKISAFDYYNALHQMTEATNPSSVPVC